MSEDLGAYFDVTLGIAGNATLDGVPVAGIFDTATEIALDGELATQAPSYLLRASEAAAASAGTALVIGASTYTVRHVAAEPPDGALTRLTLARA